MPDLWKLSPSELTLLWDECPRCFYLKVVYNFSRPFAGFPKIFNRIDKLMKGFFKGKTTSEISPSLPQGVVRFGEKWVTSQPIHLQGHSSQVYIRGKFDTVVEFTDASYGIVDFKTSEAKPEHVAFYSRQLHAYSYALENPKTGSFALSPITHLGLLCVEPVGMDRTHQGQIAYLGDVTWLECPRDDEGFLTFLDDVLTVLEEPTPPESNPNCVWCLYRDQARSTGH